MYDESYLYTPPLRPNDLTTIPLEHIFKPRDVTLEAAPETEAPEKLKKYAARWALGRRLGEKALAATLSVLAIIPNAYLFDVANNRMADAQAHASVIDIYPAVDEASADIATIYYDGFNTYGAYNLGHSLQASVQQAFSGDGYSVQYNNAVLNAAEIGGEIDDMLEENTNITAANLIVHSAGAVQGIDYLLEKTNNSWFPIETVTIISGPTNYETLTDKTQSELATAKKWSWVPFIEYSTWFRYLLEMNFYQDDMEKNPAKTLSGITERFMNGNVTNNRFLASQMKDVSNADVASDLEKLDEDKFHTIFNYIVIDGDDVVRDQAAAIETCAALVKKGYTCNIFHLPQPEKGPKIGHGDYYTKAGKQAFMTVFNDIRNVNAPQLKEERARFALTQMGLLMQDDYAQ